jgi:hypothetical protein
MDFTSSGDRAVTNASVISVKARLAEGSGPDCGAS